MLLIKPTFDCYTVILFTPEHRDLHPLQQQLPDLWVGHNLF